MLISLFSPHTSILPSETRSSTRHLIRITENGELRDCRAGSDNHFVEVAGNAELAVPRAFLVQIAANDAVRAKANRCKPRVPHPPTQRLFFGSCQIPCHAIRSRVSTRRLRHCTPVNVTARGAQGQSPTGFRSASPAVSGYFAAEPATSVVSERAIRRSTRRRRFVSGRAISRCNRIQMLSRSTEAASVSLSKSRRKRRLCLSTW